MWVTSFWAPSWRPEQNPPLVLLGSELEAKAIHSGLKQYKIHNPSHSSSLELIMTAAQAIVLKLPGGQELLVGHLEHSPFGNWDLLCLKHAQSSSLASNISSKANSTASLGFLRLLPPLSGHRASCSSLATILDPSCSHQCHSPFFLSPDMGMADRLSLHQIPPGTPHSCSQEQARQQELAQPQHRGSHPSTSPLANPTEILPLCSSHPLPEH